MCKTGIKKDVTKAKLTTREKLGKNDVTEAKLTTREKLG